MKKLNIGFFSFTCCEGCVLSFIESLNQNFSFYKERVNITYLRPLKTSEKILPMDISFVEGAISTKSELSKLQTIRKKSKKLIALGSGAINGWPSNLRNNLSKTRREKIKSKLSRQLPRILPIKHYIKIDGEIPGCPIQAEEIKNKIQNEIECTAQT